MIIDEFNPGHLKTGFTKETVAIFVSAATWFYAMGKFAGGAFAEKFGGKVSFFVGIIGAIVFNVMFGLSGAFPMFTLAWCGNRFCQSFGWPGMVKISGQWYKPAIYGTIMGALSLSFLFGDFAARKFMAMLIGNGFGWRQIFFVCAGILAVYSVLAFFFLKERPSEPIEAAAAVDAEPVIKSTQKQLRGDLFKQPAFWFACAMSFSFTLMRETFNEWTPTIFEEIGKMKHDVAADASSYFPLAGALSVILVGWLSDKLGAPRRGIFIVGGLILSAIIMGWVSTAVGTITATALVATIALVAFVLIGPYSLLAGAISLDLGGAESGALASGWIDGIGYIGGILSGYGVVKIAESQGWSMAFLSLSGLCAVTAIIAFVYLQTSKKRLASG